jgi:16S rRNA (guanine527-N7)-methyltransferase
MIEEDATRINLYFKKVKHTPNKYPRAYGQIKKKPLEG